MLGVCLYSVNKRAKNCRDKEREYRNIGRYNSYWYDKYGNIENYRLKKETYYKMKGKMLSIVKPDCIHTEEQSRSRRIYDYEEDFALLGKEGTEKDGIHVIRYDCYFDRYKNRTVNFADTVWEVTAYYLFYDFGTFSFHSPIDDISEHKDLPVHDIGSLTTYGKEITELVSMQFVRKVLDLIESGDFKFAEKEI